MRLLVLALVSIAPAALAQPALTSEASVEKGVYAAGETVTLRYTVRNEGDEDTALWNLQCSDPRVAFDTLTSPGERGFCAGPIDRDSVRVGARSAVTWVWHLNPDSLGVPERGGQQTISVGLRVGCGPSYETAELCTLGDSTSFTAPAAQSGPVSVTYDPADTDSLAGLKRAYEAVVIDSSGSSNRVRETWLVREVPLSETVAALNANDVVSDATFGRVLFPTESFATPVRPRPAPARVTPPAPNPTGGAAAFTVRLDRTEAVTVDLVDLVGRRVAVLHDGPLAGGADHRFVLAAGALPAGVYVVRVVGERTREVRRVTVAR